MTATNGVGVAEWFLAVPLQGATPAEVLRVVGALIGLSVGHFLVGVLLTFLTYRGLGLSRSNGALIGFGLVWLVAGLDMALFQMGAFGFSRSLLVLSIGFLFVSFGTGTVAYLLAAGGPDGSSRSSRRTGQGRRGGMGEVLGGDRDGD